MYISVVEDNQGLLAMVEMALTLYGHHVETYSSALSFLSMLQQARHMRPFDLVIVDLFLNQHSGIDVIDAIRVHPQNIAVIMMSAADESAFAPIRSRYPDIPILRKPFTINALLSLINAVTSPIEAA